MSLFIKEGNSLILKIIKKLYENGIDYKISKEGKIEFYIFSKQMINVNDISIRTICIYNTHI